MKKIIGYRNCEKNVHHVEMDEEGRAVYKASECDKNTIKCKKMSSNIRKQARKERWYEWRLRHGIGSAPAYIRRKKSINAQQKWRRKEVFLSIINEMSYSETLHICCFMGIKTETERKEIMRLVRKETENEKIAMTIYASEDNETKIMLRDYAQKKLMEKVDKP